jgi:hypothetical protein
LRAARLRPVVRRMRRVVVIAAGEASETARGVASAPGSGATDRAGQVPAGGSTAVRLGTRASRC